MTDAAVEVMRTEGQQLTGTLKAWNLEKGFGFLKCDDGGPDLFVHQTALTVAGEVYRAVVPGTKLRCTYYVRDGKGTSKDVCNADGTPLEGFETKLSAANKINAAPSAGISLPVPAGMIAGKIKFMNKDKGFGFITPDEGGEEMFVHVGDVEGQRILEQGEPVAYTTAVKKGDRAQAVQVKPLRPQPAMPLMPPPPMYPGYHPYAPPAGYGAPAFAPPPAAAYGTPANGSQASGSVKWFNEVKGFGFIVPSAGGPEVYFKGQDVVGGGPPLAADEAISYEVKSSSSGKIWAVNISRSRGAGGVKRKADQGLLEQHGGYKRPVAPYGQEYGQAPQYGGYPQPNAAPQPTYAAYGAEAYPAAPAAQAQYGQYGQQQYAPPAAGAPQYQQPPAQQYAQPPPAQQYQQPPAQQYY